MAEERAIKRQITLPWSHAFQMALRNIRIRLGRAMITAAGVFLGIAFLMSVLVSREVINRTEKRGLDKETKARQTWLITIGLVACSIGIANSMLMSVTERFKEIGTIKCLGALDSFIVKIFLMESSFIGILASIGGTIIGYLIMMVVYTIKLKEWVNIPLEVLLKDVGICVGIGTVLSVIAAIYPSWRAAKMPAAAALRVEI